MSEPDEAISGAVRQIVADYALDQESLHASWRCQHPDVYGPCNCVDEFVGDAVKTLAAHMADREAEAAAKALNDAADDMPLDYRDHPPMVWLRGESGTGFDVYVSDWLRDRAARLTPDTEGENA